MSVVVNDFSGVPVAQPARARRRGGRGSWGGLRQFGPAQRYAIAVLYAVGAGGLGMSAPAIAGRVDCPPEAVGYLAGTARAHLHTRRRPAADRWRNMTSEAEVYRRSWYGRCRELRQTDICWPDSLLRDLTEPGDCLRGRDRAVGAHQSARAKLRDWLVAALVREWQAGAPVDRLAREIGVPATQLWAVLEPYVVAA